MTKTIARGLAVLALGLGGYAWLRFDPDLVYLPARSEAAWIVLPRPNTPLDLPAREESVFRKRFTLKEAAAGEIVFTAMRTAELRLDGRALLKTENPRAWKKPVRGVFALGAGEHEVEVAVRNAGGPAALMLFSKEFGLYTGSGWTGAALAAEYRPMPFSTAFGSGGSHLRRCAPALAVVFTLVFAWSLSGKLRLSAARTRWLLLGAWALLAANNIGKIPPSGGFDVPGHMAYVWYIIQYWKLPAATQGWEMFQAPLYYLILAPLFSLAVKLMPVGSALQAMRAVGLLCGAAQIELAFRAARRVYPKREDLQVLGTVLGGLLPISVYMSHSVGNEALAGALSSAVIVAAWRLASGGGRTKPSERELLVLGALLGLALLTKVSALLLVLPVIAFLALAVPAARWASAGVVLAAAGAVSGWYFGSVWLQTGSPFVSGWDPARGFDFWQEPGYRTARDFLTFGQSLEYPIYAATAGFWDSIYSTLWLDGFLGGALRPEAFPRWNLGLMAASGWLALLPTAAILLGLREAVSGSGGERRKYLAFCAGCVGLYFAALLAVFLKHPFYSTAKASYTLGLAPCYAVLACAGFERMIRGVYTRAAVYAGAACWAAAVYAAYFVL